MGEHLSERTEDEMPFMEFLEQTPDYKTITLKGGGKIMVLKNDQDAASSNHRGHGPCAPWRMDGHGRGHGHGVVVPAGDQDEDCNNTAGERRKGTVG